MTTYRPQVEHLEARDVPNAQVVTASFSIVGSTLNLVGHSRLSNNLVITDNGTGELGNIALWYNGQNLNGLTAGTAIDTINIVGGRTYDNVIFNLVGGAFTNMTVNAWLGAGNDTFVANLPGGSGAAVLGGGNYAFNVHGGDGNDFLALNAYGGLLNLGFDAALSAHFVGGRGHNLMVLNYDSDGTVNFTADARQGRDMVFANVNFRPDPVGLPGTANIRVWGGDRSYISILARNYDPATANVVNALVEGNHGRGQVVIATHNVNVVGLGKGSQLWRTL